ncbi:hypothetical protein [Burkholderia cepacia]|uniref:hypothetical protein n=1 Tax=Burkholderia cepacia TaxID=292 RepID=UPI001CF32AE2|nr:hypothetical protein [Burkholderia cepacia]MCA8349946.1 hypothetical protein [Burkholderia cepacia]
MKPSDLLVKIGRPVAYYSELAFYLGGVNAAILFSQLLYWMPRASDERGVYKTMQELRVETGLSRAEQETARKALRARGVLVETHARLEHKIFYRLDLDVLDCLLESSSPVTDGATELDPPSAENSHSPMRKSSIRSREKSASSNAGKSRPRSGETRTRDAVIPAPVTNTQITAETTAATVAAERELASLLLSLERHRGQSLSYEPSRDQTHVLTWVGKRVTPEQLSDAHARAVTARVRDRDDRPTYFGFVNQFIDQAVAGKTTSADDLEWFQTCEDVDARGAALGTRPRKTNEPWQWYRVLVVAAARDNRAMEFVLRDAQRFNDEGLYRFARTTFGDAKVD